MNFLLKEKGSSLIQAMILSAVGAGIALSLSHVLKTAKKQQKNSEIKKQLNAVHSEIIDHLSNEAACTTALQFALNNTPNAGGSGQNLPATIRPIIDPLSLSDGQVQQRRLGIYSCPSKSIADVAGGDGAQEEFCNGPILKFQEGQSYAQNNVRINNLRLQTYRNNSTDFGTRIAIQYSIIKARKKGDITNDRTNTINKFIKLKVHNNASNMGRCQVDVKNIIEVATRNSCNGPLSHWDNVAKKCYHEINFQNCPNGSIPKLEWERLEITAASYANPTDYPPGAALRDTQQRNNQVLRVRCIPAEATCNPNQIMVGYEFDSNLQRYVPDCEDIPICGAPGPNEFDEYLSYEYDRNDPSDGKFVCKKREINCSGNSLIYFNNSGTQSCLSCSSGEVAIYNSQGVPECSRINCGTNEYLVGMTDSNTPICRKLISTDYYSNRPCPHGHFFFVNTSGNLVSVCNNDCTPSQKSNVCIGNAFTNGTSMCTGTRPARDAYFSGRVTELTPCNALTGTKIMKRECIQGECGGVKDCPAAESTFESDACYLGSNTRIHKFKDCHNRGGTVTFDYVTRSYLCRFRASTCPAGWYQFRNYATRSNSGIYCGTNNTDVNDRQCSRKYGVPNKCYLPYQYWTDAPAQSCRYMWGRVKGLKVKCESSTCRQNTTEIGCY